MIPILMLMAAGAMAGAAANRKDPMKGALLGAGIGATGGLLAPAAGAGLAAAGGTAGAMGTAATTAPAATGLLGTMTQYGKPAMQALTMAQQSGLMGGQEQPTQAQPFQQAGGGAQTLMAIAQQGDQVQQQLQQAQEQRRQRRMGLLGQGVA